MGCVSSKGQPPASRGATGSRAAPPAVAVGPAAVAGHQPSAKADARRSPDDPIFTTKLAATGQPKELRSGLLAAIDVSAGALPRGHRGAGQARRVPRPPAFPCALPRPHAGPRPRIAIKAKAEPRSCAARASSLGGGCDPPTLLPARRRAASGGSVREGLQPSLAALPEAEWHGLRLRRPRRVLRAPHP